MNDSERIHVCKRLQAEFGMKYIRRGERLQVLRTRDGIVASVSWRESGRSRTREIEWSSDVVEETMHAMLVEDVARTDIVSDDTAEDLAEWARAQGV